MLLSAGSTVTGDPLARAILACVAGICLFGTWGFPLCSVVLGSVVLCSFVLCRLTCSMVPFICNRHMKEIARDLSDV